MNETVRGRKVFIILTDGEDLGSRSSADEAIRAAVRSDAICYVLLIADSNVSGRRDYVGQRKMKELSESTGGRLIQVKRNLKDLEGHFSAISRELRSHYSIGFTPTDRQNSGEYRRIEIRSKQGFAVQSRKGYFARFAERAEVQW